MKTDSSNKEMSPNEDLGMRQHAWKKGLGGQRHDVNTETSLKNCDVYSFVNLCPYYIPTAFLRILESIHTYYK